MYVTFNKGPGEDECTIQAKGMNRPIRAVDPEDQITIQINDTPRVGTVFTIQDFTADAIRAALQESAPHQVPK